MNRLRSLAIAALLPVASLLLDCATLDPLPVNACGNGVVEAGEDCDTFPDGPTARCGAPSAGAASCRLLCGPQPDGAALVCPDGWGCGVTGICRAPTGVFDPPAEPVSAGVTAMVVGDFDGDGRQDVLGSSGVSSKGRIHYFRDGASPQVVPLPGVLASPFVHDFDRDGRSDIVFGYTFRGTTEVDEGLLETSATSGLAILLGQTDRAVVSQLFPTVTVDEFDAYITPLEAKASEVPSSTTANPVIALATALNDQQQPVTLLRSLDGRPADLAQGYTRILPAAFADIVTVPLATRLFDAAGNDSTCGELVVPMNAATAQVQIHSPCVRRAGRVEWSKADPVILSYPGETLRRVFAADVDGDGHQDLVIGTRLADGADKVRVAWGDGLTVSTASPSPRDLDEVPLAAGFIDGDAKIDFVVPSGVLLSSRAGGVRDAGVGVDGGGGGPVDRADLTWTVLPAPTKRWTVAQIADLNRDGNPDVVGASQYEPDLDVLAGTRSLSMPAFSVSTTGAITNLAVGDYDFDTTADIAFVQAPAASNDREVAIAYGRALTMPPEAPRPAGRLAGIRQVFSSASGLTITSANPVPGHLPTFSIAVLLSSGDRQPVAPLLFAQPVGNDTPANVRRELVTRGLTAASPSGDRVDLVALVAQRDYVRSSGRPIGDGPLYSVWRAPGTGPNAFGTLANASTLVDFTATDTATGQVLAKVAPGLPRPGTAMVLVSPGPAGEATYRVVGADGMPPFSPSGTMPGKSLASGGRAELLDLDGDGALDLVTITRDAVERTLSVTALLGTAGGGFDPAPLTVALPVPAGSSTDDYAALDFATLVTGGAAALGQGARRTELVIVTPKHLFRVLLGAGRTVVPVDATAIFGTIDAGSAVVSGDFDGDGVADLAIADQGSIRVARQAPGLR